MAITSNDYAVQVQLVTQSNIAQDFIVNTMAVKRLDPGATFTALRDTIAAFYNDISGLLSRSLVYGAGLNAHMVKVYQLTDPEPRPPVYQGNFAIDSVSATVGYPQEVALVTSISAPAPAGVRPARRRGRLFIGPLNAGAGEADASGYVRPKEATLTTLVTATETLTSDLLAVDWELSVWSRTDDGLFPVTHGWVNNEFDTQRRRGPEPTARSTWSISI